jgi:hypothetical protein
MSMDQLLALSRTYLSSVNDIPTPEGIRAAVDRLSQVVLPPPTADDKEWVARQLESEFVVDLGPAHLLTTDEHKPWLAAKSHEIDFRYWRRYKALLEQKGFGVRVVSQLDIITNDILDLAGDPTEAGEWRRRGLVVGHVQSGKTANYIGLINKAADAGYKLIILIAGIHTNLRSQTQERIDEGFVGRDSDQILGGRANANILGVGNINRTFKPVSYTSRAHDFGKARADGLGISINNLSDPAIFVIKKNRSILTNLIEWLHGTSATGDRLTMPMLVIDDEADNASINTSADPDKPNTINRLIRELLKTSIRNTYIGYTATPFANIFIDPDSEAQLQGEDLFPRDFIVGLDAPSSYVGAKEFFLGDEDVAPMSVQIDDTEEWLPVTHKITWLVEDLHHTLVDAINLFILSKGVRIIRGQATAHHSMLVNVSRFTNVQSQVAERIYQHLDLMKSSIENRHAMPTASALRDPYMRSLYDSWARYYADLLPESWESIQPHLHRASASIQVTEVNARSGAGVLNYRSYTDTGLNVIAVGGNSLSRGFTLEGLTVSYFLRNTQMYDTLLQMGRWFGYRPGYADLCRLFIKPEALDWYSYIAEATEELRDEISEMESNGLTPMDFGLAVRSHPGALLVTARNKMRTANEIVREVGLAKKLVESAVLHASSSVRQANWRTATTFIRRLLDDGCPRETFPNPTSRSHPSQLFREVPTEVVLDFIGSFVLHPGNIEMAKAPLVQYIKQRGFEYWDVVVASNTEAKGDDVESLGGINIGLQERSSGLYGREGSKAIVISGKGRRVASRGLEKAGLTPHEVVAAEAAWEKKHQSATRNIADSYYRGERSRPLLMIHLLNVKADEAGAGGTQHAAYGISFPGLRTGESEKRVAYTANVIAYRELFGKMDAEGDEDDDAND